MVKIFDDSINCQVLLRKYFFFSFFNTKRKENRKSFIFHHMIFLWPKNIYIYTLTYEYTDNLTQKMVFFTGVELKNK